jgi:hypothetical protein
MATTHDREGQDPVPNMQMTGRVPPTGLTPDEIRAAALADEDLMRQLKESFEEERRGDPAIPFGQVVKEAKLRRRS